MQPSSCQWSRLAALAVFAALFVREPCLAQDRPQVSGLEERARARIYRFHVRIEPTWLAEPRACLDFSAGDLEVRLRGRRLEGPASWTLDREPVPAVHALLIDTSRSLLGKLDRARTAAIDYVRRLRPERDRALVVNFDENVTLRQGATADHERLVRAIEGIRMSHHTALYDALVYTLRELELERGRAILLLLSDGVDTMSLHERDDVFDLLARRADVTVFAVGLALPPLTTTGPPGLASTRKFLDRLASETNGKFFDVPTTSRLDETYDRIRQLLDAEATLGVVDPDPGAEPGTVRFSSRRADCRVRTLREREGEMAAGEPLVPGRRSFAVQADDVLLDPFRAQRVEVLEPGCDDLGSGSLAYDEADRVLRGCVLDVTMDYGVLATLGHNDWLRLRHRAIEIPVPPLDELPATPDLALEKLASRALATSDREVEIDPRQRPTWEHARPYYDQPGVVHERTFFALRPALAEALYARSDYREHATEELRAEAGRELAELRGRLRALAPGRTDEELRAALEQSDAAREIEARAANPTVADVERPLAAWLGDVPAHDLFVAWEARKITELFAGAGADEGFVPAWVALRKIFWLPSYARAITLLVLGRDAESGRVGLWRTILPRPGWIRERVKGYERHPEFAHLPLDLIPDLPLGYAVARALVAEEPEAVARLGASSCGATTVRYELRGRSGLYDPLRAFRESRVTIEGCAMTIEADVTLRKGKGGEAPRISGIRFAPR